ncbi:MAG: hypothetical protein Q4G70_14475 [Pseudomonadota bacterium]|nr:hypothetical protein [Pseudomonadota bacterium]
MLQDDLFGMETEAMAPAPPQAGQWLERRFELVELGEALQKAHDCLPSMPPVLRDVFARAVASYRGEHARLLAGEKGSASGRTFSGWRLPEPVLSDAEIVRLMLACEVGNAPGAEVRFRSLTTVTTAVIHVPDVGTLELRYWPACEGKTAVYSPCRTTALLRGYRDDCKRVALPYAVWRQAVSVQALAEASDGIGSARTCMHGGREYTITGVAYGTQMEADAWAIVPRQLWYGPVYTREQMHAAYNAGDIERGDHRGQLVRVRGQLCVLEAMSLFHDASAALRLD